MFAAPSPAEFMKRHRLALLGVVIVVFAALGWFALEYRHGLRLRRSCDAIVALGGHVLLREPTADDDSFEALQRRIRPYDAAVETPWSLRGLTAEVCVECDVVRRHVDDLLPALHDLSIARDVTILGGPLDFYDADAALNRLAERRPAHIELGSRNP